MAYVAFTAPPEDTALLAPLAFAPQPAAPVVMPAMLSRLEWTVVALAEHDGEASLRAPGRVARALGRLFGGRRSMALADPRLEALRRIAVLSWQHGYTVPGHEVRRFVEAGFSPAQYELLVDRIGRERIDRRARPN